MSDLTDPEVPSIDIKHEGPESYNNMWQKTRSIWMYVDKHHAEDFDYFYLGGDDIYLIVENLRKYLVSDEIVKASGNATKPLFMGRRFLPPKETVRKTLYTNSTAACQRCTFDSTRNTYTLLTRQLFTDISRIFFSVSYLFNEKFLATTPTFLCISF
jgi:hypothetical protein